MAWKGDPHAFHDDVDGEIDSLTEKATPVDADLVIINDSADGNSVKSAQLGNLPGGGGASDLDGLSDVTITSPTDGQTLSYDGTEWVNAAPSTADLTSVEITDAAAPRTAYHHQDPQAVYDSPSHRTFIAYLGLNRDLYVTYYDHQDGTVASPVLVGTYPISDNDAHGAPSIAVDHDGHIHVVWGSHNTTHEHSKSDNPWDISAWTTNTLLTNGTYPFLRVDPATGDLYIIDRTGGASHTGSFPSHEFGGIRKSTNAGSSWSGVSMIVDTTGAPESTTDFYMMGAEWGDDGRLHIAWTVARGSSHDDSRDDIYHAAYDPTDETFYTADGTSLGSSIDWTDHTSCKAATESNLLTANMAVHGNTIAITYNGPLAGDVEHKVVVWDGSTWTDTDPILDSWNDEGGRGTPFFALGHLRGLFSVDAGGSFADLELYGGLDDGTDWSKITTVLSGDTGEGYEAVSPVLGGGPGIALTQQADTGDPVTSATASDLVPLRLVLWDDATDHDHDLANSHDHDDTYYTETEIDGFGFTGELLMQDGVTAPPVPIETEAQDDWLYEDV